MKKIIFSAQIAIFAAALPLYGYFELNRTSTTATTATAITNAPVQTYAVTKTPNAETSVDYTVKFSGKAGKATAKPVKKAIETIAKTETSKPAVKEIETSDVEIETEQMAFPQSHEWRAISTNMNNLSEAELTAQIMRELKAAFGKDFRTAVQKMKIRKMQCENKKETCTCISL